MPANGPNFFRFDDRARYYNNIDNNGDGVADIRYRFTFDTEVRNPNSFLYAGPGTQDFADPGLNVIQRYDLVREEYRNGKLKSKKRIANNLPVAPPNIGPKTFPNYGNFVAEATRTLGDGTKLFVGTRDDPFFVDLGATFDAINVRVRHRQPGPGQGRPLRLLDLDHGDADPRGRGHPQRQAGRLGRRRATPSSASGRPPSAASSRSPTPTPVERLAREGQRQAEQVGPGLAARQPADQRGRDPARQEGQVQPHDSRPRRRALRPVRHEPGARRGAERAVRRQRAGDGPHRHRPGAAHGHPGPQPAHGQVRRHAGGHAEAQPRRRRRRRTRAASA